MSSSLPLLLEIGVEELPLRSSTPPSSPCPRIVADELARARLSHGDGAGARHAAAARGRRARTSRRGSSISTRRSSARPRARRSRTASRRRPPRPSRRSWARASTSLAIVEKQAGPKQKAGRYVVGRRVEKGRAGDGAAAGGAGDASCAAIPFRKSMRWARPRRGLRAARAVARRAPRRGGRPRHVRRRQERRATSRGHRFLAPATFDVKSPGSYVEQLRERHVLVDRDERVAHDDGARRRRGAGRRGHLRPRADARRRERVARRGAARRHGHRSTARSSRSRPAVIRAVARGHQRYFCVPRQGDRTSSCRATSPSSTPRTARTSSPRAPTASCARASRTRASSGQEDQKTPLDARYDKLGRHRLPQPPRDGEGEGRAHRAARRAHRRDARARRPSRRAAVARAARLCKCDLVTLMVGEFPELQGHMGRAYALGAGRAAARSPTRSATTTSPSARRTTWRPDDVSAAVALADRLDTLAGCFAVGLAPTGAADPFALRRACIGALRTLLDRGLRELSFADLVGAAYDGLGRQEARPRATETRGQDRGVRGRAAPRPRGERHERRRSPTRCSPATAAAALRNVGRDAGPRPRAQGRGRRAGAVARQGAHGRQAPGRASAARRRRSCTPPAPSRAAPRTTTWPSQRLVRELERRPPRTHAPRRACATR